MASNRERVRIELEELPDDVPFAQRVKRLLKFALRACHLKAVKLTWPPDNPPAVDGKEGKQP
jgi:hypothetical protein